MDKSVEPKFIKEMVAVVSRKILSLLLAVGLIFPVSVKANVNQNDAQSIFNQPSKLNEVNNQSFEMTSSLKYRKEVGLNHSEATVKNIKMQYKKSEKFGVYLTPVEELELTNRFSFQESTTKKILGKLNKVIKGDFTLYIDQARGGVYHLGLKDINIDLTDIVDLFSDKSLIVVNKISKSEQDLDAIHESILSARGSLMESGIIVSEINTDVRNETVIIGIENLTQDKVIFLHNMFGSYVTVREASGIEGTDRSLHYNPLRGGTRITKNSGGNCSVGFMVNDGYSNYVVTAGHCGQDDYTQGGTSIGYMSFRTSGFNSNSDSGIIGQNTNLTYTGGRIYNTSSSHHSYNATQNASEDVVGESVCMSGASTTTNAVQCGLIQSKNYTSSWSGMTFNKQRLASYIAIPGDSGGTVFYSGTNTVLKGVQSARRLSDSYGIYSHLEYVIQDMSNATNRTIQILF
ncbi:S1 family peptidase [Cohnella sp.]|uniref:S1 family peptidase n=1 Tax=Cohnella sp. TaxID=1883426 RepID=UPI0035695C6D